MSHFENWATQFNNAETPSENILVENYFEVVFNSSPAASFWAQIKESEKCNWQTDIYFFSLAEKKSTLCSLICLNGQDF